MDIKVLSQNIVNNPKDFTAEQIENYFIEYANQIVAKDENWIRVDDELPRKDDNSDIYVLVYETDNTIRVRPYNEYHKCWDTEDGDDYYCNAVDGKVTHWRQLPNKPITND